MLDSGLRPYPSHTRCYLLTGTITELSADHSTTLSTQVFLNVGVCGRSSNYYELNFIVAFFLLNVLWLEVMLYGTRWL